MGVVCGKHNFDYQLEEAATSVLLPSKCTLVPNLSALEFLETMQLNCNIFPNILN